MGNKVERTDIHQAKSSWAKLKEGNISALGELYDLYADKLFAYAIVICNDREIVKDEIHNLFLELFKYHKTIGEVSNIEGYLMVSMKRRLFKVQKRLSKEESRSFYSNPDKFFDEPQLIVLSPEDDFIANENKKINISALEKIMSQLTDHQQKIINLRFREEKTYEQIADDLSLTVASTRTLVYRTLKTIRNAVLTIFL